MNHETSRSYIRVSRRPRTRSEGGIIVADRDDWLRFSLYQHIDGFVPRSQFRAAKCNLDGLRLALATHPDLFVAAVDDPELSGFELAAIVRGHESLGSIRLVLAGEKFTAADVQGLAVLGVFRTLLRPATDHDLLELLEDVFGPRS